MENQDLKRFISTPAPTEKVVSVSVRLPKNAHEAAVAAAVSLRQMGLQVAPFQEVLADAFMAWQKVLEATLAEAQATEKATQTPEASPEVLAKTKAKEEAKNRKREKDRIAKATKRAALKDAKNGIPVADGETGSVESLPSMPPETGSKDIGSEFDQTLALASSSQ